MATAETSSFRDPSGWLFHDKGKLYRAVTEIYQSDYDLLMNSGLYQKLVERHWLVAHTEVSTKLVDQKVYKVIEPELIPLISYPYEWSFSQWQDAALLTLQIQRLALQFGMSLKDASAYNIQFLAGRPILIDTLSFEVAQDRPWVAYQQFCQHFLAPLALMAYVDFRLGQLLRVFIDGVPLDLATRLLPQRSKLHPGLLMHLHLHASSQRKHAEDGKVGKVVVPRMSRVALEGIVSNLEGTVRRLKWQPSTKTEWANYYQVNNNYSDPAMKSKEKLVAQFVQKIKPARVWDLGGNTGRFSQIAVKAGAEAVCWDIDPVAVEAAYRHGRDSGETKLLPLWQDFTNPSPDLGWDWQERRSLKDRGRPNVVMALALIHHLAISNNVPLSKIAAWLAELTQEAVIIEFIPKSDSQVQILLATREDIFDTYTQPDFEQAMQEQFKIVSAEPVKGSKRTLYLLRKK